MKQVVNFSYCVFLLLYSTALSAQKEDNVWMLGGLFSPSDTAYRTCSIDFTESSINIDYINKDLPYDLVNSIFCDSSGSLAAFTNGKHLFNRDFEIMDGGFNFYPNTEYPGGVNYMQGYLLLPSPSGQNKVLYIYGKPKVYQAPVPGGYTIGYIDLLFAIVDMSQNNGLGKVIARDINIGTDTVTANQLNVSRHGNGRDWWLLIPYPEGNRFYRYLIDPMGIHEMGSQDIPAKDPGIGHTCFSPDGHWYARFNWHGILPDSSFATLELYRFDRCSGLLSERVAKTYDLSGLAGRPGGVAFSPSSRFLYVTRWDTVFQYDLHTPDILASEQVVAVYDGFFAEPGLPTRFFYPLLAPDEKIYICVSNYNSPFLHTIEEPNMPGIACDVQQHSVRLPVFNNTLLPHVPFYRLWAWEDSPCDTLGSVGLKELVEMGGIKVYPNPAHDLLNIEFESTSLQDGRLEIFSLMGQRLQAQEVPAGTVISTLPLNTLPNGVYLLRVMDAQKVVSTQKFTVQH